MSQKAKVEVTPEVLDKALDTLKKSISTEETVTLEKGMKVDKRAMGGDTKAEEDPSVESGRKQSSIDDPKVGMLPASKKSGNFANEWKTADAQAEAEAVEEKALKTAKQKARGLSKSEDGEKSVESKKEEVEKAFDAEFSKGSKKSEKKEEVKKSEDGKDEKSEKSAEESMDGEGSLDKGIPAEEPASKSGAVSGSPELNVSKAISFISSAHKHLTKAFEDGSEKELDRAGERLVSAKKEVSKAIKSGHKVDESTITRLEKAGKYYAKAIQAYEAEDADKHIHAVEKSLHHMEKAVAEHDEIKKSLGSNELRFVRKDGKVTLEMTEEQYASVHKSLSKDNLYKSLENNISEDAKKTIDAVPALKDIFKSMSKSNDELRDAILDTKQKDREFKKSVGEAIEVLGSGFKKVTDELEALKGAPMARKSVVTVAESPLAKSIDNGSEIDTNKIGITLEKGLAKGLVDVNTVLAWDIDKTQPEYYGKYVEICKSIDARIK